MTLISMNKVKEALAITNPDKREIAMSGRKAMQEVCDYWVLEFAKHIHEEQQKTGERNKVYAKDIRAAFTTFIMGKNE
jgi:hypothetical protein|tara:strand:+ start:4390 stop:4623 length:234 start_codon:yes stop_codon:yes gene_type:complete